jgi:glutamate synthase domain-containing protein 1
MLAHKQDCTAYGAGEINTLQGNLNWVASREHRLTHPVWENREADFLPLTSASGSDSANLDAMAEFLVGSLTHLVPICVTGTSVLVLTVRW